MISPSQRPLPDNTQHSQQTNIHAPAGIRTHNRSRSGRKTYSLDLAATGTGNKIILTLRLLMSYIYGARSKHSSPPLRTTIWWCNTGKCRSQWPRGLRRRSTAARLLRLWVRIPPGAWMFVCCECCVLSGRGLCDGLIIRSEESYRLWRVVVCDQETSYARRLKPAKGL